jgi:hypothetical protein
MPVGTALITLAGLIYGGISQYNAQKRQNEAMEKAAKESRFLADRDRRDGMYTFGEQTRLAEEQMGLSREGLQFQRQAERNRQKEWQLGFQHNKDIDAANQLMALFNNDATVKLSRTQLPYSARGR